MYRVSLFVLLLPLVTAFNIFSVWNTVINGITSFFGYDSHVDARLNISELAAKYGYPFEEHRVNTEDGYILNLHRIKHGRSDAVQRRSVVFLMHGILDSSDGWVLQGPDSALAYILADSGFDVWMGNARGNKHSLKHASLKPDDQRFWDFTWEEIGLYDLPASIDYILNATAETDLYYVGYSQGTTCYYVMTSMKPEYNNKIKMMFSLAPVAWLEHAKSPLVQIFSPANEILGYALASLNAHVPSADSLNKLSMLVCVLSPVRCDNFLSNTLGYSSNVDEELIPVILGHAPTGCSTLQFVHYGQLAASGRFGRYDHGRERNLKVYGQETAPDYACANIKSPVVLFHSGEDWFSDKIDVERLKDCLPNVRETVYIEDLSHIDFVYAKISRHAVYDKIVSIIDNFEFENGLKITSKSMRYNFFTK